MLDFLLNLISFNITKHLRRKAEKNSLKSSNMFQKAFIRLSKANDALLKAKAQYAIELEALKEDMESADAQIESHILVQSKLEEFIPQKVV